MKWANRTNIFLTITEIAELLINHGADVNAKAHYWSGNDETPLVLATSQKCKLSKK